MKVRNLGDFYSSSVVLDCTGNGALTLVSCQQYEDGERSVQIRVTLPCSVVGSGIFTERYNARHPHQRPSSVGIVERTGTVTARSHYVPKRSKLQLLNENAASRASIDYGSGSLDF